MNNRILVFVQLIVLTSCGNWYAGINGVSRTMKDTKKMNLFIAEYEALVVPYCLNDTICITVESAWIEKSWLTTKKRGVPKIKDGFNLRFNVKESEFGNFNLLWLWPDKKNTHITGVTKNGVTGYTKEAPPDTIRIQIKPEGLYVLETEKPIGELILVRRETHH